MKYFLPLLLLISIFSKVIAYSKPPPVITDVVPKYTVVYATDATYQFTLDTEKLNILKANTPYLKILTFKSDKEAIIKTIYTS